jgi:hypothetical protein
MAEQAATQSGAQTPSPAPAPVSPKVEPSAEVISKAVAYLLIEKGIIKRDELIEKMKQIHEKQGG